MEGHVELHLQMPQYAYDGGPSWEALLGHPPQRHGLGLWSQAVMGRKPHPERGQNLGGGSSRQPKQVPVRTELRAPEGGWLRPEEQISSVRHTGLLCPDPQDSVTQTQATLGISQEYSGIFGNEWRCRARLRHHTYANPDPLAT